MKELSTEFDVIHHQARRVASFGLPGGVRSWQIEPSTETSWAFLRVLIDQRITGLAVAALSAGGLHLAGTVGTALIEQHKGDMALALALEDQLLVVAEAFDSAEIEFLSLKGPSLAHSFYPQPSWRTFRDVDLLVKTHDWQRACVLLATLGFHRKLPAPRPGFDERFGKAATHRNGEGFEVDLHRTLVVGPFGLWMAPEHLFQYSATYRLGGRALRCLDDTGQLVHACMHAMLGSLEPLLISLRDVTQVLAWGQIDWARIDDYASRWRLGLVLGQALERASNSLGAELPVPAAQLAELGASGKEKRALRAYTTVKRLRGGPALATMSAIPGIGAKLDYLRALVWPDDQFLVARRSGECHSRVSRLRGLMLDFISGCGRDREAP